MGADAQLVQGAPFIAPAGRLRPPQHTLPPASSAPISRQPLHRVLGSLRHATHPPDKVDLLLSVAAYGLNNNATSTARHSDDCPLPERAA
jgi:hypothetical protein